MRIAIDLSPLQNAHRMRGIGFTLINFINNLSEQDKQENEFIFYLLPEGEVLFADPYELINLENVNYESRSLKLSKHLKRILPGRLNLPFGAINRLLRFHSFYYGDSRVGETKDIDIFLQADQSQSLPSGRGFKKILIIYDLIPQILEWDYLVSYRTARMRGDRFLKALILQFKRQLLINKIKANTRRAHELIAISETTKKDFVSFLNVSPKKITVSPLGVSIPSANSKTPQLIQSVDTGWGYARRPLKLDPNVPFLLFIGGVDSRRKLEDVVAAFNNLRGQGHDLKLVLAGDIMLGPDAITTPVISDALARSSYLDDIIFMGFTDDASKDWLYANALAYIFPSRYEGFGLPVLEAMIRDCPVIAYHNAAVTEVAGDALLYANNLQDIMARVLELLNYSDAQRDQLRKKGAEVAKKYDWARTSTAIMKILYNR